MDINAALDQLRSTDELSIIRLTEPIFATRPQDDSNRLSNASSTISDSTRDPATLKADLQHYRDLFSKLRFSYVEQITKEKFLRAITEDTPEVVTADENATLVAKNKERKALLAEKKEDLRGMLQDLEAQGRELARRYHEIELQTTQLETLPIELEELDSKIASLETRKEPYSDNPEMRMPLRETVALVAQREREAATINAQLETLRSRLANRQQEVQQLEEELGPLQLRREHAVSSMQELEKTRQDGNAAEYQGRWLLNSEKALKLMLEV